MTHRASIFSAFYVFLCLGFIAGFTFNLVFYFHTNWAELLQGNLDITQGRADWRAFQNRLLGPYLILFINYAVPWLTLEQSMLTIIAGCLAIHNALLFILLRIAGVKIDVSLVAILIWSFFFAGLQHEWLFTWDVFDILFLTFAAFVLVLQKDPKYLLYIYPLALLNRESALFLPVAYMMASVLCVFNVEGSWKKSISLFPIKRIGVGLFALFFGIVYTKLVRDYLFVELETGNDFEHQLIGNHFYLFENLKQLMLSNFFDKNIIHTIPIWLCVAFHLKILFLSKSTGAKSGALFFFLLFVNTLIFGLVNETRLWFPVISLTLFVYLINSSAAYLSQEKLQQQ